MKAGVLFSGGKDSTLALHIAAEKEKVVCLITVFSKNKESYMFHTPNIDVVGLQAEALGLPLVTTETEGNKEEELQDLQRAIVEAIKRFQINCIVTGAIESVYQSSRIQKICDELDIECLNPLWKHDQKKLLEKLVDEKFRVIISGIFAYPLDEKLLGKQIDLEVIARLVELQGKYGISPSGEGGEIETTVLDAPLFKRRIKVLGSSVEVKGNSGVYNIKQACLMTK